MQKLKLAVLVIGYNREKDVQRLLTSLKKAEYDQDTVDLIVSIDNSGTDAVEKTAKAFEWPYGEKHIFTYPKRMGLRAHILHCGTFLENYDAMAVLEDDLVVSPAFFYFMKQTVAYYQDHKDIAGISLYTHLWNVNAGLPFIPAKNSYDVYMIQMAQSWGQIWLKDQWSDFMAWYSENSGEMEKSPYFPDYMVGWSRSWLKYHNRYCVEKNKYFVTPYISYTTCFTSAGEHSIVSNSVFQVPMAEKTEGVLKLPEVEEAVRYDVFFERMGLGTYLGVLEEQLVTDLYGLKYAQAGIKKYLLSNKKYPYKIVRSFDFQMRPHEANIVFDTPGNSIFLYDTEEQCENRNTVLTESEKYCYYHRIHGNTKLLGKVFRDKTRETLKIKAAQFRKKLKK